MISIASSGHLPPQNGGMFTRTQEDLPTELLLLIFLALMPDTKSILTCREVCSVFRNSIDASVKLQLEIKLRVWGYERLEHRKLWNLSDIDVLQRLERHIMRWDQLNWEQTTINITKGHSYDLAHGYFVTTTDSSRRRAVAVVQLPSSPAVANIDGVSKVTERASSRVYNLPPVSFEIVDLAIDPSQDLLILEEMCVYSISRARNTPQPYLSLFLDWDGI